jgi:hypothetical protein
MACIIVKPGRIRVLRFLGSIESIRTLSRTDANGETDAFEQISHEEP